MRDMITPQIPIKKPNIISKITFVMLENILTKYSFFISFFAFNTVPVIPPSNKSIRANNCEYWTTSMYCGKKILYIKGAIRK